MSRPDDDTCRQVRAVRRHLNMRCGTPTILRRTLVILAGFSWEFLCAARFLRLNMIECAGAASDGPNAGCDTLTDERLDRCYGPTHDDFANSGHAPPCRGRPVACRAGA